MHRLMAPGADFDDLRDSSLVAVTMPSLDKDKDSKHLGTGVHELQTAEGQETRTPTAGEFFENLEKASKSAEPTDANRPS